MFACWTIVKSPTDMSSLLLCWAALFSAGGGLCEWKGNALIWWMSAYLWEYWWPMCSLVWGVIFCCEKLTTKYLAWRAKTERNTSLTLLSNDVIFWMLPLYATLLSHFFTVTLKGSQLYHLHIGKPFTFLRWPNHLKDGLQSTHRWYTSNA